MNDDALMGTWLLCFIGPLVGRNWLEGGPARPTEYNNFCESSERVVHLQESEMLLKLSSMEWEVWLQFPAHQNCRKGCLLKSK